ncbi:MAG: radical SAM protein [Coriobacteriales bacterium]|nr:B12-binding domain-containing radical SAM protein [Actinomycetes bacterium]
MSPHAQLSPPLGLAYVAAHLRDAGHHVELIDLNVTGFNPQRLEHTLGRLKPGLVGISALTETYPNAVRIAALVKERDPRVPVIIGGPHASILPADVLAEPWVDFVAVGEGERTAVELAAAVEDAGAVGIVMPGAEALASIRGLGWRRDGEAVLNASRPPLDAAEVGRPARDLLSLEFYHDAHNILTARGGCPYRCPFCSASHLWGGRRRPRPPSQIMAELDEMADAFGAGHVFFVDDIFTLDRRWLDEMLGLLEERRAGVTWGCATRVDLVSERLLRRMASAGCTAIQFGIESGAQEVLDSVKGIKKPDALNAVRWTVAAGMTATCSFMVPFPEDTEETLAETLEFMREVKDAGGELLMSFTTPYPGTKFAEEAEELGLTILTDDWSLFDAKHVVMATRHLSAPRIEALAEEMAHTLGMRRSVV